MQEKQQLNLEVILVFIFVLLHQVPHQTLPRRHLSAAASLFTLGFAQRAAIPGYSSKETWRGNSPTEGLQNLMAPVTGSLSTATALKGLKQGTALTASPSVYVLPSPGITFLPSCNTRNRQKTIKSLRRKSFYFCSLWSIMTSSKIA